MAPSAFESRLGAQPPGNSSGQGMPYGASGEGACQDREARQAYSSEGAQDVHRGERQHSRIGQLPEGMPAYNTADAGGSLGHPSSTDGEQPLPARPFTSGVRSGASMGTARGMTSAGCDSHGRGLSAGAVGSGGVAGPGSPSGSGSLSGGVAGGGGPAGSGEEALVLPARQRHKALRAYGGPAGGAGAGEAHPSAGGVGRSNTLPPLPAAVMPLRAGDASADLAVRGDRCRPAGGQDMADQLPAAKRQCVGPLEDAGQARLKALLAAGGAPHGRTGMRHHDAPLKTELPSWGGESSCAGDGDVAWQDGHSGTVDLYDMLPHGASARPGSNPALANSVLQQLLHRSNSNGGPMHACGAAATVVGAEAQNLEMSSSTAGALAMVQGSATLRNTGSGGGSGTGVGCGSGGPTAPGGTRSLQISPTFAAVRAAAAMSCSVECGAVRGIFSLETERIHCRCSECVVNGGTNGCEFIPSEFERHGGMAACKKWRFSIKVTDTKPSITLGRWLDMRGVQISSYPSKPKTRGGRALASGTSASRASAGGSAGESPGSIREAARRALPGPYGSGSYGQQGPVSHHLAGPASVSEAALSPPPGAWSSATTAQDASLSLGTALHAAASAHPLSQLLGAAAAAAATAPPGTGAGGASASGGGGPHGAGADPGDGQAVPALLRSILAATQKQQQPVPVPAPALQQGMQLTHRGSLGGSATGAVPQDCSGSGGTGSTIREAAAAATAAAAAAAAALGGSMGQPSPQDTEPFGVDEGDVPPGYAIAAELVAADAAGLGCSGSGGGGAGPNSAAPQTASGAHGEGVSSLPATSFSLSKLLNPSLGTGIASGQGAVGQPTQGVGSGSTCGAGTAAAGGGVGGAPTVGMGLLNSNQLGSLNLATLGSLGSLGSFSFAAAHRSPAGSGGLHGLGGSGLPGVASVNSAELALVLEQARALLAGCADAKDTKDGAGMEHETEARLGSTPVVVVAPVEVDNDERSGGVAAGSQQANEDGFAEPARGSGSSGAALAASGRGHAAASTAMRERAAGLDAAAASLGLDPSRLASLERKLQALRSVGGGSGGAQRSAAPDEEGFLTAEQGGGTASGRALRRRSPSPDHRRKPGPPQHGQPGHASPPPPGTVGGAGMLRTRHSGSISPPSAAVAMERARAGSVGAFGAANVPSAGPVAPYGEGGTPGAGGEGGGGAVGSWAQLVMSLEGRLDDLLEDRRRKQALEEQLRAKEALIAELESALVAERTARAKAEAQLTKLRAVLLSKLD